jgi:hypothetical protein
MYSEFFTVLFMYIIRVTFGLMQEKSHPDPASYPVETGGSFPGGYRAWGVKLTTHMQLMLMSNKHGSIYPLSCTPFSKKLKAIPVTGLGGL